MKRTDAPPLLTGYPQRDTAFVTDFTSSFAAASGRVVDDEGVRAACEAMLRTSYPLAVLRHHVTPAVSRWEAFRDDSVFDEEMVRRARDGDRYALDELYERHHSLSYAVAAHLVGPTEEAIDAVADAFAGLVRMPPDSWGVRTRLGIATRQAALRITGRDPTEARESVARSVVHLAAAHSMQRGEIAAILHLNASEVAVLAVEGMRNLRSRGRAHRHGEGFVGRL